MKAKVIIFIFVMLLISLPVTTSKLFFYHTDHLSSPRVITDEKGEVVSEIVYLPFGSETTDSNETRKYNSKELDDSGLYYYGARYYDADIGRFITPDNVQRFPNPYVYVSNNPMNMIDPSGEIEIRSNEYILKGKGISGVFYRIEIPDTGEPHIQFRDRHGQYSRRVVYRKGELTQVSHSGDIDKNIPARYIKNLPKQKLEQLRASKIRSNKMINEYNSNKPKPVKPQSNYNSMMNKRQLKKANALKNMGGKFGSIAPKVFTGLILVRFIIDSAKLKEQTKYVEGLERIGNTYFEPKVYFGDELTNENIINKKELNPRGRYSIGYKKIGIGKMILDWEKVLITRDYDI